ncbi:transcriptional regulator GntR family protein [Candidatus Vecturithrix granuli]|uniref:Transcriptional regulator GntR family protein n=1 Tax=Vecturithrix granuli TaxID=1499967 RepID=A0A0S6W9Q0_VECG1|nr:transcriptional regulator GntR family protein [Candidatus Vecturithrix granuli]
MLLKEPLYLQLAKKLRAEIQKGNFEEGDQFYAEREICRKFDISRITANKAISILITEGYLEHRKGKGTFVKSSESLCNMSELMSFTKMAALMGRNVSTKVLEFRKTQVAEFPEAVANHLNVGKEEDVFFIRRVRCLEEKPVILDRRVIRARFCPELNETMLSGSLISGLENRFGLYITGWDQRIQAVSIDQEEAQLLEMKAGDACLSLKAVGLLEDSSPLWYEWSLFHGRHFIFSNRVNVHNPSQPAERVYIES